jgi:putative SOS response-associated peptidase YedK
MVVEEGAEASAASFNAQAETVAAKPMFRDAFRRNRCVILASGYYEWLQAALLHQPTTGHPRCTATAMTAQLVAAI